MNQEESKVHNIISLEDSNKTPTSTLTTSPSDAQVNKRELFSIIFTPF